MVGFYQKRCPLTPLCRSFPIKIDKDIIQTETIYYQRLSLSARNVQIESFQPFLQINTVSLTIRNSININHHFIGNKPGNVAQYEISVLQTQLSPPTVAVSPSASRTYHKHVSSLENIRRKTNLDFFRRTRQLDELKHRKKQSFSHSQHIRNKQIEYDNALLLSKICAIQNPWLLSQSQPSDSLEQFEEKIRQRNRLGSPKDNPERSFILKNHRQSPIYKQTLLERTKENARLASKIINPVASYNTKSFLADHRQKDQLKGRIMKYEAHLFKSKAQLNLEKRLLRSSASPKASLSVKNPVGKNEISVTAKQDLTSNASHNDFSVDS